MVKNRYTNNMKLLTLFLTLIAIALVTMSYYDLDLIGEPISGFDRLYLLGVILFYFASLLYATKIATVLAGAISFGFMVSLALEGVGNAFCGMCQGNGPTDFPGLWNFLIFISSIFMIPILFYLADKRQQKSL